MIIYKCDGKRFSDNKECQNTFEAVTQDEFPEQWIVINGKIKNGLPDRRCIESNATLHFCSRSCLEFFLFKNVSAKK